MMKKSLILVLFLALGISLVAESLYVPGQLLIKSSQPLEIKGLQSGIVQLDSYLANFQVKRMEPIKGMPSTRYFTVYLKDMPPLAELKSLNIPGIEYIEPNYLRRMHATPNDPLYSRQFHHLCNIPRAWNYSTGNKQIIVGVVDSGLLINHPDIMDNVYINPNEIPDNGIDDDGNGYIDDWCGWDFVDAPEMADVALGDYLEPDNDVTDENYHGTHVSGIIGAKGNNGIGISGVCWNISIMPLRAGFRTTTEGFLQDDDAAAAIIYAADNGCRVINMSWGDPAYSAIIADACDYAYNKGVVLVASSGNTQGDNMSYPARLSSVISVGSVNSGKILSTFSSYGHDLDLVAPGEMVLSTYKEEGADQYMEMSGTSMSAPFVSGSIALLLSLMPQLSPAEVRARLLSSTDDLGDPGYDMKTGHGMLNTQKLLEGLDPPFVEIISPADEIGVASTVEIIGSVYGEDFARYTLMYRSLSNPAMSGWLDAREHVPQPTYFTQPVVNGRLGEFYIPHSFAEGKYLLRLQYQKTQNNLMKYNYYRTITVDRTAPVLRTETLLGFSRYDRTELKHYISCAFDEKVLATLKLNNGDGYSRELYTSFSDSLQVWALPGDLPEGKISIQITAENSAGLSYESPLYQNFMDIHYESVPTHGFSYREIGKARVPLDKMVDFNDNGKLEYVAMDVPEVGYGAIYAYEPQGGVHLQTNDFGQTGWPLDIGNTNSFGQELLMIRSDTGYLWETKPGQHYPSPDSLLWQKTGVTGGCLVDYDNNGRKDIVVVTNLPAQRVVEIYSRNNMGNYLLNHTLVNNSPTETRNNFVPTVIVDKLDADNQNDVLTADTDGDVMIYEAQMGNEPELVWERRMPVGNTYQLAVGDFDGDGQKDFIVGGYNTHLLDPDLTFWYFEAFTTDGNNSYKSMGNIMFNQVISQNTILVKDIDGDGKDEVILGISPSLYILKYIDGEFKPIFMGDSFANYRLAAREDEAGKLWIISNYSVGADSLIAVEWGMDEPFTGPATPANFSARPLDEHRVQLNWIATDAEYYRLFRKAAGGEISLIDSLLTAEYIDMGLTADTRYEYAIAAVNTSYSPSESVPSAWQSAIPLPAPQVESITMVGSNILRVYYNQAIPAIYQSPGHYELSHGVGRPQSVNNIAQSTGVQLLFREAIPATEEALTLAIYGIYGNSGVAMQQTEYSFYYVADIEPPQILSTQILKGNSELEILFSEDLAATGTEYLANYILTTPANDPTNSIIRAEANGDKIKISLAHPLKYSDQAYYIRVENLTDLSGNLISKQHNLARFALREIKDLKQLIVYPNPINPKQDGEIVFMNFPPHKKGKIAIYSASGNLVYTSSIGPFNPDNNRISYRWNLKNNKGHTLSSGVYFYIIEMAGERTRGKLAIIN
ncbi:MAG: S8 family serine peptidase [Candidatus Cloacimonetes bacterium]|nr:S8 family serine peptidase [Candidatus Cloacimonadota bacterium]